VVRFLHALFDGHDGRNSSEGANHAKWLLSFGRWT
jgi:hypothetical protein